MVAGFTPGGAAALASVDHAPRRRLVAVLGVAGAGLLTATIALGIGQGIDAAAQDRWMWLAALAGLLVAGAVHRTAPGVVPTIAVGGFLAATTMLAINALGWMDTAWAAPLAMVVLAVFGSLVLARVLPPQILVEAVSIGVWLIAGAQLLGTGSGFDVSAAEADASVWIGRASLAALIAVGAWAFMRGGSWPWAVGVAAGSAALIGLTFAEALGGAIAMTVAGIVLIVTSVLLLRTHRRDGSGPAPAEGT